MIKINDVLGFHTNAAIRNRATYLLFDRGPVNINEAAIGIKIVAFLTTEPEDTGHNRITSFGVWLQNYSGLTTALEDCAFRCSFADFFCNDMVSKWSAIAT